MLRDGKDARHIHTSHYICSLSSHRMWAIINYVNSDTVPSGPTWPIIDPAWNRKRAESQKLLQCNNLTQYTQEFKTYTYFLGRWFVSGQVLTERRLTDQCLQGKINNKKVRNKEGTHGQVSQLPVLTSKMSNIQYQALTCHVENNRNVHVVV